MGVRQHFGKHADGDTDSQPGQELTGILMAGLAGLQRVLRWGRVALAPSWSWRMGRPVALRAW